MEMLPAVNVLGGVLQPCSMTPRTGFFRMGCATLAGRMQAATRSA